MSDPFTWRPLFICMPETLALELHGHLIARIDADSRHAGYVVTVNLQRDYTRRTTCVIHSRALGIKLTERWARANFQRLLAEVSALFGTFRNSNKFQGRNRPLGHCSKPSANTSIGGGAVDLRKK